MMLVYQYENLSHLAAKKVTLTVAGTAYYHDLGKFLAGFENEFPHIRLLNLDVNPSPAAGDAEKLVFKMDIVYLCQTQPVVTVSCES